MRRRVSTPLIADDAVPREVLRRDSARSASSTAAGLGARTMNPATLRRAVDALRILGVDAGVADVRRRHRDDLAGSTTDPVSTSW